MTALWFLLNTTLAVGTAAGIALLLVGRRDPLTFILGVLAAFPLVTVGAILITGFFGLLYSGAITILLACAVLLLWRTPDARKALSGTPPAGEPAAAPATNHRGPVETAIAIAVTATFLILPLIRILAGGMNLGSDDLSYHGPSVAEWVINHRVVFAPYDYHAYYPFTAEALAAWFALPFHGDGLAGVAGAFWFFLLWFATTRLVTNLGGTRLSAYLAAALAVAAPFVTASAVRFSSPDIAGVAMILAALALLTAPEVRGRVLPQGHALFIGLILGFAAGCKVSYVFALAVIGIWLLFPSFAPGPWSARVRGLAAVAAGVIATGTVWYVRNWIVTGNPLFPAQVGPFAGPFSPGAQARTKLITWIIERPTDVQQWLTILRALIDWPPGLFGVSFAGYLGGAWLAFARRKKEGPSSVHSLIAVLGLILAAAFLFLPFSGTDNDPSGSLDPKTRFLVLSFVLGVILFCSMPARHKRTEMLMTGGGLAALLTAWSGSPWMGLLPVLLVFLIGMRWDIPLRISTAFRSHRTAAIVAGLAIFLLGLVALEPFAQRQTSTRLYDHGSPEGPVGAGWKALGAVPAGSRIAWYTNKQQEHYPLFGRSWEIVPIPTDAAGKPYQPLHVLFAERPADIPWWGEEKEPDSASLLQNLSQLGIDFVFISRWGGNRWPVQQAILARSGAFTPMYDDGYSVLWTRKKVDTKLPG